MMKITLSHDYFSESDSIDIPVFYCAEQYDYITSEDNNNNQK